VKNPRISALVDEVMRQAWAGMPTPKKIVVSKVWYEQLKREMHGDKAEGVLDLVFYGPKGEVNVVAADADGPENEVWFEFKPLKRVL
jgi:hypothetical protein